MTTGVYYILVVEVVVDVGAGVVRQGIVKFMSRYAYYVVEN